MGREDNHVYQVDEGREPGTWGPFCVGCSYLAGHYVYPCRLDVDNDERVIPTMPLYTPEKVQDMINEVLADMQRDGVIAFAPEGLRWTTNVVNSTPMLVRKIEDVQLRALSLDLEPNAFGQGLILPKEDG